MSNSVIGLDIGGTKIWAQKYDMKGTPLGEPQTAPTEALKGPAHVVGNIAKVVALLADDTTVALGVSWAGFVDSTSGVIKHAPNIQGFKGYPLAKTLTDITGLMTVIENDARLFAYGEAMARKRVPTSLLGIIIGTGVGSGLIINGQIYSGFKGYAGEIGHAMWNNATEMEDLLSGRGIDNAVRRFGYENMTYQERNATVVADKEAHKAALEANIEAFGHWIANLSLLLDPEVIVVGGGAGTHFWRHWKDEILVTARAALAEYPTLVRLEWSSTPNPGALGAAFLAIAAH